MTDRKNWHKYFMDIAFQVASRSTCPRKQVGAVLVKDKIILATGFNGSVKGLPHCNEAGCMIENDHCTRTIHAEINAITQAGISKSNGSTLYITASPCWNCFKVISNSGINTIIFNEFYRDEKIFDIAKQLNINLFQLNDQDLTTLSK